MSKGVLAVIKGIRKALGSRSDQITAGGKLSAVTALALFSTQSNAQKLADGDVRQQMAELVANLDVAERASLEPLLQQYLLALNKLQAQGKLSEGQINQILSLKMDIDLKAEAYREGLLNSQLSPADLGVQKEELKQLRKDFKLELEKGAQAANLPVGRLQTELDQLDQALVGMGKALDELGWSPTEVRAWVQQVPGPVAASIALAREVQIADQPAKPMFDESAFVFEPEPPQPQSQEEPAQPSADAAGLVANEVTEVENTAPLARSSAKQDEQEDSSSWVLGGASWARFVGFGIW